MIRLHCTKRLIAKLPRSANGRLLNKRPSHYAANDDEHESILSGWHANLLTIQRCQCVLFVHDATRFPVFIPALKKVDLAELDELFADSFMNTLLKTGADDDLMNRAQAALAPFHCDNDCDRSVQGTMNQMARDLAFSLAHWGVPVREVTGYRQGAWLADRPCTVKGRKDAIWPQREMKALLLERVGREPVRGGES
jgi:hypothetical protein